MLIWRLKIDIAIPIARKKNKKVNAFLENTAYADSPYFLSYFFNDFVDPTTEMIIPLQSDNYQILCKE